jgi:hypothetical protein
MLAACIPAASCEVLCRLLDKSMPETINTTSLGQIIGGIFSNRENADKAVEAFRNINISSEDIQIVVKLNDEEAEDSYTALLLERGFSESQALYHNKVIREGKILVVVYEIQDPAPVIDIFDRYKAEYNPDGSRNLRGDVAGMTVGAAVGGVVGGVLGGPLGAVAGAAAGAVVGGGSGAAAGKAVEHRK